MTTAIPTIWTAAMDSMLRKMWRAGATRAAIAAAVGVTPDMMSKRRATLGLAPRNLRAPRPHRDPAPKKSAYVLPFVLGKPREATPLPALHPYTWGLLTAHAPDLYASPAAGGSSLAPAGRGGRPAALPLGGAPVSAGGGR